MRRNRTGFSLIELLLALTMGMVVLTAATRFGVSSWNARRGWTVKESVDRSARFVGLSLARDAQEAGIGIESTPVFGSLATFGDTVSVLSVPMDNDEEAPVYPIWNDGGEEATYPEGGTCGADCIDFLKVAGNFEIEAGHLARLQVGAERRLLFITDARSYDAGRFRIRFKPVARLLGRESGLDSIRLERAGTSLQRVNAVVYWRDPGARTLHRAGRFDPDGRPAGFVVATEVEAFDASLLFTDGGEHDGYNGLDADTTNDGNKIIGLKVRAKLKADRVERTVNNGQPFTRWYEWRVAPRNLLYEKSREG